MKVKAIVGSLLLGLIAIAAWYTLSAQGVMPFVPGKIPTHAARALTTATGATLYALKPSFPPAAATKGDGLHGYRILGHIEIDQGQAAEMGDAVKQAFGSQSADQIVAACIFEPNRALRIVADGNYDFLLDAGCDQLAIYHDDQKVAFIGSVSASGSRKLKTLIDAVEIPLSKPVDKMP